MTTTDTTKAKGKTLRGSVVKAAMQSTVTVLVERYIKHPKYKKYYRVSKKYLVHNPEDLAGVGDVVAIRETRPISKHKHFVVDSIVRKAAVEEDEA